ncbi:MAG: hypothetical protein OXO49_06035 [Gammaproteobacteria bacterium]|nr:hypothetical protein [Gammaproteobacteria bacterium]MDE0251919.1 hypothetical protein [Gammaproteobacteria bacterium]MDE0403072.1 hypothetical protein [Gammaproteobacteria bacterium]
MDKEDTDKLIILSATLKHNIELTLGFNRDDNPPFSDRQVLLGLYVAKNQAKELHQHLKMLCKKHSSTEMKL